VILQALYNYYVRQSSREGSDIPSLYFSREKISFCLVIDSKGDLLQVNDLREGESRKRPVLITVPEREIRTSKIAPNFLWENAKYIFGIKNFEKSDQRSSECYQSFVALHEEMAHKCDDPGLAALVKFLEKNPVGQLREKLDESIEKDFFQNSIVFRLSNEHQYLHQRPLLKKLWIKIKQSRLSEFKGQCLVTGKKAGIAPVHGKIMGVRGGASSGTTLVSFNDSAYWSYRKEQNYNAPISEEGAFAYTTALNHLLTKQDNKINIGDTTIVFWAERESPVESYFGLVFTPEESEGKDREKIKNFFKQVKEGMLKKTLDMDIPFYVLGLAPNKARIAIRFWYISTVGEIVRKMEEHLEDIAMIKQYENEPDYPPLWRLLVETTKQKKSDDIHPLLVGQFMKAILSGGYYPGYLLSAVINRVKMKKEVNYYQMCLIKGYLSRYYRLTGKEKEVPMALDYQRKEAPYLLGRLFAVLEKAQDDCSGATTIKDRYFGSASSTPGSIFPVILRLNRHHLAKMEKRREMWYEKLIQDIMGNIEHFPKHLRLEEQGMFAIGYYHQRKEFYTKKEDRINENKEVNDD